MSSRPRLISLDAFAKTVEDAKIKTASGGMITLVCVFIVLFLIRNEYVDYTLIITRPELVVDRDVNKKLDINIDILFPNLPCDVVTLDLLDLLGDIQLDVLLLGFQMYRLVPGSSDQIPDDLRVLNNGISLEERAKGLADGESGECGLCYGSLDQENNAHCCNDCATVRVAYAEKKWAFYDGENIAQCENEGYVTRLRERIDNNEGCRIVGSTHINRISGNMHFAPGASFTQPGSHVHDLSLYDKYPDKFNFDHVIHHLLFGNEPVLAAEHSTHPLDGHSLTTGEKRHLASYYLKVVATRFEYLNTNLLETNQFSVISHHRPLSGGKDDDHQHTLHARGGLPGVFFHFEISPLKIINREQYAKTWSGFVLGVVSSVAGVLMVGALLDRLVWAAEKALKGKKDL